LQSAGLDRLWFLIAAPPFHAMDFFHGFGRAIGLNGTHSEAVRKPCETLAGRALAEFEKRESCLQQAACQPWLLHAPEYKEFRFQVPEFMGNE